MVRVGDNMSSEFDGGSEDIPVLSACRCLLPNEKWPSHDIADLDSLEGKVG